MQGPDDRADAADAEPGADARRSQIGRIVARRQRVQAGLAADDAPAGDEHDDVQHRQRKSRLADERNADVATANVNANIGMNPRAQMIQASPNAPTCRRLAATCRAASPSAVVAHAGLKNVGNQPDNEYSMRMFMKFTIQSSTVHERAAFAEQVPERHASLARLVGMNCVFASMRNVGSSSFSHRAS